MKITLAHIQQAVADPATEVRAILLYGPDEAASRDQATRVVKPLGADAERIDFTGAQLKADPALLADEAASISLFGGRRHIRVEPVGDEAAAALEALLEAPSAGNPVIFVAGALRKDAKLVKLAAGDKRVMALVNYPPNDRDMSSLASEIARGEGLRLRPDIASRLAAAAGGDRAILAREVEKLACYLDATPDNPTDVEHEALDALGADADEGDLDALVNAVVSGQAARADAERARLAGSGVEAISIIRRLLQRFLLLAKLRGDVDGGQTPAAAVANAGKTIFWKSQAPITHQLGRWDSTKIATAIGRLAAAERAAKSSHGAGSLAVDAELLAISRQAARLR